jgi:deoxyadenosine/deoxycytidine kinase
MSEGRVFIIDIAGIPGSGKSTISKRLKRSSFVQKHLYFLYGQKETEMPLVKFVKEPVNVYRERGYLQKYYGDSDQYALAFQLLVFDIFVDTLEARIASAKKKLLTPKQDIVLIIERGTMFDQLIFWKLQVDLGKKSADAMCDDAYMGIWKKWNRFVPSPLIIFFFQTTDIQTTMQRVKQRARVEELGQSFSDGEVLKSSAEGEITNVNGLTLDYQKALLAKHQEWFTEPKAFPPFAKEGGISCVHVNVDQAFHMDNDALEKLAKEMAERIFLQINAF